METIVIAENDGGQRLDRFLKKYLKNASLSNKIDILEEPRNHAENPEPARAGAALQCAAPPHGPDFSVTQFALIFDLWH